MRYVPISKLEPGMVLGHELFDGMGRMLLARHSKLNEDYIQGLIELGFPGAYIDDEFSKEIEIKEMIRPEMKREALKIVNSLFMEEENFPSQQELNVTVMKLVEDVMENADLMCNMMDIKNYDDYTYFHSVNVAVLSTMVGLNLGMNQEELKNLTTAAMLHDIGKRFVDKSILLADGSLSPEEIKALQSHAQLGSDFLRKNYDFSAFVYAGVMEHHEWFSGEGYPMGKSGNDIPLIARIIKLVDAYDGLVSNRPGHKAESPSDAVEYLMGRNGREFDPVVLDAFLKKIAVYPIGCQVKLSDGREAMVIENYKEFILRPKIKIIGTGNILDLKEDTEARNITIVEMMMK